MKYRLAGLAALALAVTGLAGTPVSAADRIVVGGIIYARDSQYWQQVQRGMNDAAKALDVDLQVGLNRRQLPTEAQLIDDFITRGVKAIVMPPLDRQGSVAAAGLAKSQGIVLVDYDAPLADDTIASHTVGVDSVELAAKVGAEIKRTIASDFGGTATLGMILVPPTNPNLTARRTGLMKGLEGAEVNVVGEVTANTPEQGASAFEDLSQRDPSLQIVWASNAGGLQGAATAAQRSGSKVKLYGIDMSRELAEMLLDPASPVQAISDQQPYQIGYAGVEAAVKTIRGEQLPRQIAVDSKLYTKRDTQSIKDYLARLEDQ